MPQTVLAIDDSPDIHRLLDVRLKPEGLVLHHAADAHEGIRLAQELCPDLILLDLVLPYTSGFEICSRLKNDPKTALVPIIFLSGATDVFNKVTGFDLGAVDYVTKPFDAEELRARVRAALRTKRYQDMLAVRAQVDALTGLWNRGYFDQRLEQEMSAARRFARNVCLVLLDLDHFKRLNDAFGHPFGDKVLQGVGEAITATIRESDAACRYGGEEFGIILTETSTREGHALACRLKELVAALEFTPKGDPVSITASLGVAGSDRLPLLSAASMLDATDTALYDAKASGRNTVCVARPSVSLAG